ncbi:hypothetical protein BKH46_00420 [Helicobacter sp. 12S02634-8]|uniref:tRNA (5-methylaminomethyl-2-thiouridine)(34)-methyltransferase MnmD n=1 Tax=Helicobacter sp. 12S02634-8 TaxID=1476199 RepID=UPI000BA5A2D6|nr:MnmC family methyltransferase [Helicobacter sp. 12S02634-8]PAF48412.1 hypothetical protein BKH46_00420 [Helicobacter sp. 12S02634-8]
MEGILSCDGSLTLFNQEFNQCYHSLKDGAYTETLHKHILPPILFANALHKPSLNILDICFGLGYNTFTTIAQYIKMGYQGQIKIFTPEKDRSVFEKILGLEYPYALRGVNIREIIAMLSAKGQATITPHISLELFLGDAREYLQSFEPQSIDIIYQDAFSPKANPELWSLEYFSELFKITHLSVIITTYSTHQATLARAQKAGFLVYKYASSYTRKSTLLCKQALPQSPSIQIWNQNRIDV